ncbi:MAG: TetR/AcrR family transcriptional regulator [Oscillospiraceae bacterium]|nr:TetR/AcrR family transcriptional regulator [Oscillospiraceae bacterium]
MNHEEMNQRTEAVLIGTFKALMLKKPMNKITVSELVEECGINRKTFYYHFEDIRDMLRKMLRQDIEAIFSRGDLITDHDLIINSVLDYIEQNKVILKNMISCIGRAELDLFLNSNVNKPIYSLVCETEQKQNLSVGDEYKRFLADFFTLAVSGVLIDWIENRADRNKEQIKQYLFTTLSTAIPAALNNEHSG